MARSAATNYTAAGEAFEKATAASDAFEKGDVQMLAEAVDQHAHEAGRGVPVQRLRSGLFADLPADGNAGAFYLATDTDQLFFDNGLGAGWLEVAANPIQDSDLRDSAGISVIGRSAATAGAVADIQASGADQVLRESAGVIGFGTVATGGIADSAVTNAKLGTDLDASKLTAGLLPIARIDDASVTNAKLATGIDASKLTTGYLPIARIEDGTVTYAKLASDAVQRANTLTLPDSGWVGRGAAALRFTFYDSGNVIAASHALSVPAGQAIYLEGYGGDTYLYYDSGTSRINVVVNGVTVGYLSNATTNGAGQLLTLDGSGLVPLADIPTTLTGKDADTLDGSHASAFANASNLSSGTLSMDRIAAEAVVNAKLGNDIDAAKLSQGTLNGALLGSQTVANAALATGISATKITTGTLDASLLASGAVTAAKIANRTRKVLFPWTMESLTSYGANTNFTFNGLLPSDYDRTATATVAIIVKVTAGVGSTITPSFVPNIGPADGSAYTVLSTIGSATTVSLGRIYTCNGALTLAANTYNADDVIQLYGTLNVAGGTYFIPVGLLLTYTADS